MGGIIQLSCLGKLGRFGNQLFQYLYARHYAEQMNSILEIPYWIGKDIFKNIDHPKISCKLNRLKIDEYPNGRVNIDLYGYFQKQHFVDVLDRKKILEWLQFKDEWIERFEYLKYEVVAHLRRGDYQKKYSNLFCIVDHQSYIDACKKFELDDKKMLWLSEETESNNQYNVPEHLSFLTDFFIMVNSNHLLRANSSFSFWAGFFNVNNVYCPIVRDKVGINHVDFVNGNSEQNSKETGFFNFS